MEYQVTGNIPPKYKQSKGYKGFKKDLEEAQYLENQLKLILEDFADCIVETSQDQASFSDWDLKVDLKDGTEGLKIEVKQDRRVAETGNIAVELGRIVDGKWKDTCLSVTKSDVYAYYFFKQYHFIKTSTLKQLVDEKKYAKIVAGGDANRARCAIFPKELFLKHVDLIFKA
jgi:hypothetical protein